MSPVLNHKVGEDLSNKIENYESTPRNTFDNKGIKSIVEMDFEFGDELKFLGYAEGFESHIVFDSPTNDSTYNFVFTLFECGGLFTDQRDWNIYQTVLIGDQCWMVENLSYLPEITYENDWGSFTQPQYAVYGYAPGSGNETVAGAKATENYQNYGVIYNWSAALTACPPGWHLPNDEEWAEFVDYVDAQGYTNKTANPNGAGNALKSCRQPGSPLGGNCDTSEHPRWNSHSTHSGFDEFGFAALPGGSRGSNGSFFGVGHFGDWWSATERSTTCAWYRNVQYDVGDLNRWFSNKSMGFSVRCSWD